MIYDEDMTFNDQLKHVISNIHNRVRVMITLNTANWGPTQETATIDTQMKRNCLKSTELARRLPSSHPRRIALDSAVPRRNDRTSWAHQGNALTSEHIPQSGRFFHKKMNKFDFFIFMADLANKYQK